MTFLNYHHAEQHNRELEALLGNKLLWEMQLNRMTKKEIA